MLKHTIDRENIFRFSVRYYIGFLRPKTSKYQMIEHRQQQQQYDIFKPFYTLNFFSFIIV